MNETGLERIEIGQLLEGIHRRWGYDFTDCTYSSLKRRLDRVVGAGLKHFAELRVLRASG